MKSLLFKSINCLLALVTCALACMPTGVMWATTITTTALTTGYGSYFADDSKGLADLHAQVFYGSTWDMLFTPIETKLTVYRQSVSNSTSVMQAGQIAHTPNGTYSFKPAETPLFWLKADYSGSSYKMRDNWLGELHQKGMSQEQQPFAVYIIDEHLIPQFNEDKELYAFSAVYVAPTPGTSGNVQDSMDGFKKQINNKITATTVSPISTGTIPTDQADFVTYIEEFVKDINKRDWKRPMTLAMSPDHEQMFKEGMEMKYNSQYKNADDLVKLKHFPNITVSGEVAMIGSTKIFCSPKKNLVHPYTVYEGDLVKFQVDTRTLLAWADQDTGYGCIDDARFYTNSEELPA